MEVAAQEVWANIWCAVLACEAFDAGVKWEKSRMPTEVLLSRLRYCYTDYTKLAINDAENTLEKPQEIIEA